MKTRAFTLIAAAALLVLSACGQQERVREIDWAKAALARNPAFEIVATDDSAGVFTVRDTATGTVRTLRLEDLIAAPLPPKSAAQPAQAAQSPAEAPPAGPESAAPMEPDGLQSSGPATLAGQTTPMAEGAALAEGPGYSISRGHQSDSEKVASAAQTLEGPGYSIVREEAARQEPARDKSSLSPGAAGTETAGDFEHRTDPIICQGNRLMHIDGETLEFSGDALIAERGCDLYISNAHIRAGGIGIIARQARVHIVNSTIGGTRGSYEASEGAEIYVARSTFSGIGRRFDTATMNDLGGNDYNLTH
jgi:hypothetical protein